MCLLRLLLIETTPLFRLELVLLAVIDRNVVDIFSQHFEQNQVAIEGRYDESSAAVVDFDVKLDASFLWKKLLEGKGHLELGSTRQNLEESVVLEHVHVYPVVLIAWQNDLDVFGPHVQVVDVWNKRSNIAHVSTRPVVNHVLEKVLVVEENEYCGADQLDVNVPSLHVVPNERVVDVDV